MGDAKLDAAECLTGLIADENFGTVDCRTSFVRIGGPNAELDVETRMSGNSDLKRELLEGRRKVLTKTDFLPLYDRGAQKHALFQ